MVADDRAAVRVEARRAVGFDDRHMAPSQVASWLPLAKLKVAVTR